MAEAEQKEIQQRWIMVGIGGGGGKVSADFILKSRYLRQVVDSVYFMNTAGEDIVNLRDERLKEAFRDKWIIDLTGEKKMGNPNGITPGEVIPIRFIKYSFYGTGNNFVRSRKLIEENVLKGEEELKSETKKGSKRKEIIEGLSKQEESDMERIHSEEREEYEYMYTGDIETLKDDLKTSQNVILVHSLGGGTGGGSAPVLARWIKENTKGIREPTVISICMLASALDGPLRMANSLNNLMAISKEADVVILFSNDILLKSIGDRESRKMRERIMNEKIVEAMDILLSPMVCPCSVEFDSNNLKTYLRMIFYNDEKVDIQLNIVIPFVSVKEEKAESAPVALNYALGAPQVPICNGSLISLVPFFLSSNEKIADEDFHYKNLNIYCRQVEVKHLQGKFKIDLQSVTGVHDSNHGDGKKNVDVLALGLGKLDVESYITNLDHPFVKTKWNEFLREDDKTYEERVEDIRMWMNKYMRNVDSIVSDMTEWHEKRRDQE